MKKNLIVCLLLACCTGITAQVPNVFALDGTALSFNKAKIYGKEAALMPAYKELLKDADKALQFGPVSVMEKLNQPPSGDRHDYMSLAPYFWPDPSKPDGLPYMRKDGETNPEVRDYKDKDYMPRLCEEVSTLGLAYYFSDNPVYADHAAKLLRVWFIDTATRMNPNLNFGQAIKGVTTGRGAGMIDSRHFVKLLDGVQLLKGSKAWKASDNKALQQWFTSFLHWMQTSKIGRDEMAAKNNHGDWYDAQRMAIALYIDSNDLAKKIVWNAEDRLDKQLDKNNRFPLEMERTTSLHYSGFALQAFFIIAQMAQKSGIDFWSFKSEKGKSLAIAFNELRPYLAQEKEWDGPQIKAFDFEEAIPLLRAATEKLGCKTCAESIKTIAGEKIGRLRINLLYR
ncbi:MAG: alginate lyase family protein [Chitinophagaceae bacterium]